MQITNGSIEYEHPHKVADYQVPKAKVSLSFTLDGDDPENAIAMVGQMARLRAIAIATGSEPQQAVIVPPTPPAAPTTRRGAVMPGTPASFNPSGTQESGTQPPSATGPTATIPASPSEVAVPPTVAVPPATVAQATLPAAPPGQLPSPASDPRLTDQALSQLCGQIVNKHQQGTPERQATVQAVSALRTEYTGNPALTVAAIPAERRAEFFAKLSAIQ